MVKESAEISKKIYELDKIDIDKAFIGWVNGHHSIFKLLNTKFPIVYHKYEPEINLFYSKKIIEDNIINYN